MKNKDAYKDSAIDLYYNEYKEPEDDGIESSHEYMDYMEKLECSGKKLNVLDEDIFDFEINTLAIIEAGSRIKEKKKFRLELALFVAAALILLSLYAVAGFVFGLQAILISQVVIITLIPWIVVPIVLRRRRNGVNE